MRDAARPENPEVATGAVLKIALGFLGFVAVSLVALLAYYHFTVTGDLATPPSRFAAPRLQTSPRDDLREIQRGERGQLQGYAWVDRDRGIARIPIEDAMAIVAARGARAFDPLEAGPRVSAEAKP